MTGHQSMPPDGSTAGYRTHSAAVRHQPSWPILAGAALLLCCVALLGHTRSTGLPELGDTAAGTVTSQVEQQIGETVLRQVRAQLPTSDDPLIKYYTENLLYDIAVHSELRQRDLQLVMIDSPQINAFAAPGNVIGVNLGLYLTAHNVHEFSGVLAHELAHLSQRHFARSVEMQQRQTIPMVAAMIASIALAATTGADVGLAALSSSQAAAHMSQMRHSRAWEQEADRIGINTLASAGMDPNAMASMFERMHRAHRFTQRPPEFLVSHPVTESRITDARNRAAHLSRGDYEDSEDYQLMRARVLIKYANSPAVAVQQFRDQVERHGLATSDDSSIAANAATYGLALALSRAGQHDEALETGTPLFESRRGSILHSATHAEILMAARKTDQAIDLLEAQLRRHPDNKPLSLVYAKALSQDGRHFQAEAVLQRQAARHAKDPDVWFELAETAGLSGNILGVHQARAEYFALSGNLPAAIRHLRQARDMVAEDNFALNAKLQQRMADLQSEMAQLGGGQPRG